jgi:hypothetical protein
MSAIGEFPDRVMKIFNNIKEYPTNGQFVLNLWTKGKPVKVTIDD